MIDDAYEIVSVEPTGPPKHMDGNDWHCYVIEQGRNTIRGYQQGNIDIVRQSVDEIVTRLNERRFGKRGQAHVDKSAQAKKNERK